MAADNPDCEGAIATDFITQMGETTKEAKEFLKLLYIELPNDINLARVSFECNSTTCACASHARQGCCT